MDVVAAGVHDAVDLGADTGVRRVLVNGQSVDVGPQHDERRAGHRPWRRCRRCR